MEAGASRQTADPKKWTYRLAIGAAYVISPLSLPPLLIGMVLFHFGAPAREIGRVAGVVLVFLGLIPLGYLVWMVRRRQAFSIEVRDRRRRTRPFMVSIAAAVGGLAVVWATNETAPALIAALMGCLVLNTVVLALVTLRWKISVHSSAAAGFGSTLLFVALTPWPSSPAGMLLRPWVAVSLFALTPLLMWARVRVGAHTKGQVWAGALFGLVAPYAELFVLLKLGLFGSL